MADVPSWYCLPGTGALGFLGRQHLRRHLAVDRLRFLHVGFEVIKTRPVIVTDPDFR